jgi:hypothetical protein
MLTVNNKMLSQKPIVLSHLLIVAISGIVLFSGISINLANNQAQERQQTGKIKVNKL